MSEEYLSQLIGKYARGTATKEEVSELMNWYHAVSIDDVQWPAGGPGEKEEIYHRMLGRLKKETKPTPGKIMHFPWIKIAAMLFIVAGAGLAIAYFSKPETPLYITISNPLGAIQKIRLPDSSYVWLNASTSLRYRKSFQENREVQLDGEAFFEVSHDPSHPFIIEAGDVETTVLGTAFDIKAYSSEKTTSVSVIHGRVQVAVGQKPRTILLASNILVYDRQSHTASLSSADSAIKPAWT
ncbi:MAG: FecR family protein, partial [Flavisolibacter sp.]